MTAAETHTPVALLCLRVSSDSDPGVLVRLLGCFQNLNVTPRRVVAEFGGNERLHLQIDVTGLSEDRLTLIAAKIGRNPSVHNAYWYRS